ncbi:M48 family metallopeptidase [Rhodobacter maris]|uniref:Putative metalloprotease n=1 Tax=Rhodobacter maris TaxID=446682 RepID=A0A285RXH6_9RHOB|nr:M48 family metallopeptidase [Rhodobacter maris]SOB98991.1 putative metalloprotease [Rhodobacter maris]
MLLLFRLLPFLLILAAGLVVWHLSTRATVRKLAQQSHPLNEPDLTPVIEALRKALGIERLPVFVHEIPQVNGLAAPDGSVYLTEGFVRLYRQGQVSAEELASVIAHEIGHVARGHAKRRMIDFSGQNLLRFVLTGLIGRFIPVIGPWIANLITEAVAARLSQKDEYEADEFATALLLKAGIGADPQLTLFEKLDAITGARAGAVPAWLLSHPATADRIAAIRTNLNRWNAA